MIALKKKSRSMHGFFILLFLLLATSTIFFIMYKYHIEGEKKLPFNITKIIMVSSAETENLELKDGNYQTDIVQKNDIFIALEKNEDYTENDAIKKVILNNFDIIKQPEIGEINIYRTSMEDKKYVYLDNYKVDELQFMGGKVTNLKEDIMTIANQGGLIEFSVILNNIGKITYLENENVIADGTLLNKLELNASAIRAKISFDFVMELTSGKTFKTKIFLELPSGDIINDGVVTKDFINQENLVFKRF